MDCKVESPSASCIEEGNEESWIDEYMKANPGYKCPLCPESKVYSRSQFGLKAHWINRHTSKKVVIAGSALLPCFKNCRASVQTRAHYHCLCTKIVHRKCDFLKHLQLCTGELITLPTCTKKPSSNKTIKCKVCDKNISKNNFIRHTKTCENKNEDVLPCVLVDTNNGIFMVSTGKGGAYHPNHCKVLTTKDPQVLKCFDPTCSATTNAVGRSGLSTFACKHIISCLKSPSNPMIQRQITQEDVNVMIAEKVIKEETGKKLCEKIEKARTEVVDLAVSWSPYDGSSNTYMYISVWTESISYFSKFGRVIVRYNTLKNEIDCPCSTKKTKKSSGCLHKSIAKTHICANLPEMVSCFVKRGIPDVNTIDDNIYNAETESEEDINTGSTEKSDMIVKEADFLRMHHMIPSDVTPYLKDDPCDIDSLSPVEEKCLFCPTSPLLIRLRQKSKATIYDISDNKTGVPVFTKQCPVCLFTYKYAEYKDGLHMADNTIVLTFQLCLLLRTSIKHHTAVSTISTILAETLDTSYPKDIFKAYLHFEALSDHKYAFDCVQCGRYPSILVLDANRKTCFPLKGSTIQDLPDDITEDVDMMAFWNQIERHALVEIGSKKGLDNPYKKDIQYRGWSQWISPNSINSSFVINTEYKKLAKVAEPIDLDELDKSLSDEYIDTLLCEGSVKFVKEVAKEVGLSTKGSKMDIIVRLQTLIKSKSSFKKIFTKLWGRSGGFLAMLCPHGLCYGIKPLIRAESVRDHIDMILSLEHQPNVVINDLSNMTFRHGNNRQEDLFSPHEGRVVEATPENIELAKEHKLSLDLKFLDEFTRSKSKITEVNTHPITGSNIHLALADRFHEDNMADEKDILRSISHVNQLRGLINTQVCEQMFSDIDRNLNFMNRMKPENHLFFLRLICHLRNIAKNDKIVKKIKEIIPENMEVLVNETEHKVKVTSTGIKQDSKFIQPAHQVAGIRGIFNAHQNCWLNSSMQSIAKILRDPENLPPLDIDSLNTFFKELFMNFNKPYDPTPTLQILSSVGFAYNHQHDAHEFLSTILPQLNNVGVYEPLVVNSERKCCNELCPLKSSALEQHFMLTMQIDDSIQESIDAFLSEQILETAWCDTCNQPGTLMDVMSVINSPQVVALHLSRFKVTHVPNIGAIQKDNTEVLINRIITIKTESGNTVYRLQSMICHKGDLMSGHYWSVHTNIEDNTSWIYVNDSIVFQSQKEEELDLNIKKGSYILFYEKLYDDQAVGQKDTDEEKFSSDTSERGKRLSEEYTEDSDKSPSTSSEIPMKSSPNDADPIASPKGEFPEEDILPRSPSTALQSSPKDDSIASPKDSLSDINSLESYHSDESVCAPLVHDSDKSPSTCFDILMKSSPNDADPIASPKGEFPEEDILPRSPSTALQSSPKDDSIASPKDSLSDINSLESYHSDESVCAPLVHESLQSEEEYKGISSSTDSTLPDIEKVEDTLPEIRIKLRPNPIISRPQRKRKRKFNSDEYELKKKKEMFCVCIKADDGRRYVACNGCNQWFHPSCLDVSEKVFDAPFFFCLTCQIASRIQEDMVFQNFLDIQPTHSIQDTGIWKFKLFSAEYVNELLVSINNYKIQRVDLKSIDTKWTKREKAVMKGKPGWLTDEIVNAFISSMVDQKNSLKEKKYLQLDCLSWKSDKINPKIIDADVILLPIIEDSHWTIAIVTVGRLKRATIKYYDPLGASDSNNELLCTIKDNFRKNKLIINKTIIEKQPQQTDSKSCGVFICMRAVCEVLGKKFKKPTSANIELYRKVISTVIMLQGDLIFPRSDSSNSDVTAEESEENEMK